MVAGDSRDRLHGGAGDDRTNGNGGRDVISAGSGDDVSHGNRGDDLVFANRGVDESFGGAGDDVLFALAEPTSADPATGSVTPPRRGGRR